MPLISVVVPIYNVERYLAECLESLAHQTHADLEVLMVDDGSTDSSAAIAEEFAARDPRFRLIRQPNGGLGNARNTGADVATGDYLAFVDSDDVVVRNAYELLVGSLEQTGSDFASGNYHRLTRTGTWQSAMVASTFTATRLKTHVTKHPALLNDRTAWNKLFRRSFWTQHGFRWPEGVLYEDIPVTLPAHVLAGSVDVLRQPIYLWRARAGDSTSITQRRTEPRAIRDRTSAVDGVSRFLADRGLTKLKVTYDRSVAEQDLRYFLAPLDQADEAFQQLFLDLVNDYFDRAQPDVFDPLPAIHRLQWHLVRRRLLPELLEVLRFEKSGEIGWTPILRKRRRFYGDYPFRTDPGLAIPESVYRLEKDEIPLRGEIEDVRWEGDDLVLHGWAHIAFQDLSRERSARIRLTLEESGHPENVVAMSVRKLRRPDVTEAAADGVTNYDWSGFEARVPVTALKARGGYRSGHWRLRLEVRTAGIVRRRWLAKTQPGPAKRPPLRTVDGARIIPTSEAGDFAVEISARPAEVTELVLDGNVLDVRGLLRGGTLDPEAAALRLAREDGTGSTDAPAATGGTGTAAGQPFLARVDLDELPVARPGTDDDDGPGTEELGEGVVWDLSLVVDGAGTRVDLVSVDGLDLPRLATGAEEFVVRATRTGRLRLVRRHVRPEVESAAWSEDGSLELTGRYLEPTGADAVLHLVERDRAERHTLPLVRDHDRFRVVIPTQAMDTVAGPLPLSEGQWELYAEPADGCRVRVKADRTLLSALPAVHVTATTRRLRLLDVEVDDLVLTSEGEPARQAGRAVRERLRTQSYPAFLRLPRRDAVLVDAYPSGEFGGDARAVFEELAARDTGLDVIWSAVDGQAAPPAPATRVPRYSSEWYDALARCRYVVAGDLRGTGGLLKRDGQRVVQTWHGVPVTGVGLDDGTAGARLGRGWEDRLRLEAAQWDVLLSAGPAMTRTLEHGFGVSGVIRETGLPRHDLLSAPDSAVIDRVRTRLGIDRGARVVLYTPTYRPGSPHRRSLHRGIDRYRFELELEAPAARDLLGDDAVLLVRPHPKCVDAVAEADGTRIVDVSRWPDLGELLLAADALLTDWSSVLVDYALLRRPMVVVRQAAHLETGGDPLQEADVPGAVVGSVADGLEAAVAAARSPKVSEEAYDRFLATWAPGVDGRAAARAVDALLEA